MVNGKDIEIEIINRIISKDYFLISKVKKKRIVLEIEQKDRNVHLLKKICEMKLREKKIKIKT